MGDLRWKNKMGYCVIGFVEINFNCKVNKQLKEDIEAILKNNEECYYTFYSGKDYITFELNGNKIIDNTSLIEIKDKFKKYILEIICNEYVETGQGFYYSSEEVEE